jgi:hypothetical protein
MVKRVRRAREPNAKYAVPERVLVGRAKRSNSIGGTVVRIDLRCRIFISALMRAWRDTHCLLAMRGGIGNIFRS